MTHESKLNEAENKLDELFGKIGWILLVNYNGVPQLTTRLSKSLVGSMLVECGK